MPITLPVSYTTVSLMYIKVPEIASISTLTSLHLATFAGEAEALINAKIGRYYALPFDKEIPLLQSLATDIAVYYVLSRRIFTQERMNVSTWPDRYKEAMNTLDSIAQGEIQLIDSSGSVISGRADLAKVFSTTKKYIPTFWEGPFEEQIQDQDKIDDEAERRGFG